MIRLHNGVSRQLEDFVPRDPNRVTMYVCGPTVYAAPHIGNARPAVVFDALFRLLQHTYPNVSYARNITDIDDKIITAANERGVDISDITSEALLAYHGDLANLQCLSPTIEPKATDNITGVRTLIKRLIAGKHAYVRNGEVFFHVPSNPHPGMANHTDLESGGRVEVDPKKRDPRDFVLWKPAKPGEPWWNSPWGKGRPGWHIECSAMIAAHLGEQTIDIHGGGHDLRFPHHDAEMAQSHCANGHPLANYWMHNGLLTVEGEKMSKSLGNVILVGDLLKRYPGESVRFYFLMTHYRSPLNYTHRGLKMAHRALDGLYDTLAEHDHIEIDESVSPPPFFLQKLERDLNTAGAIANLHLIAKELEEKNDKRYWKSALLAAGKLLGLFNQSPTDWRHLGVDTELVDRIVAERDQAREARDWQRADEIRTQLAEMGVALADGVHGTQWRRV